MYLGCNPSIEMLSVSRGELSRIGHVSMEPYIAVLNLQQMNLASGPWVHHNHLFGNRLVQVRDRSFGGIC